MQESPILRVNTLVFAFPDRKIIPSCLDQIRKLRLGHMILVPDPLYSFPISRFAKSCIFREKIIRVDIQNLGKFYRILMVNWVESLFQIGDIPDILVAQGPADLFLADLFNLPVIPKLFAGTGMYRRFRQANC